MITDCIAPLYSLSCALGKINISLRLAVWALLILMSPMASGQSRMQAIYEAIQNGRMDYALNELDRFQSDLRENPADSTLSDIYYFRGLVFESKSSYDAAIESFYKSCEFAERAGYIEPQYLDTILRIMRWEYGKSEYESVVINGKKAIAAPAGVMEEYPFAPYIFSTLISALSYLQKYAEIPALYIRGKHYQDLFFTPGSEEYYELSFAAITAHLAMGNQVQAQSIYYGTLSKFRSAGKPLPNIERNLAAMEALFQSSQKYDRHTMLEQRRSRIEQWGKSLLLSDSSTRDGAERWRGYFEAIRETLGFFYFDTADRKDEEYWNWFLAQLIVHFSVCCDTMQGREAVAYDNALMKQNFLDYHSDKLHKAPCTWKDVAGMLEYGEAAIEITAIPDEALIIKKGIDRPLCIRLDSLLVDELLMSDVHNAADINRLYCRGSALCRLWARIEESLKGVSVIYLSTSNYFNHFNFGAIPLGEQFTVSDKYDLRTVVSTSDIRHLKQLSGQKEDRIRKAVLYGGIQYDLPEAVMVSAACSQHRSTARQKWAMTRGLERSLRGEFGYLDGTLTEIESIADIFDRADISTRLLSGENANEESFKSLSGEDVDVLHIATHGFLLAPLFNSNQDTDFKAMVGNRYQTVLSQSGLLMSGANTVWQGGTVPEPIEDGILTAREILDVNLSHVRLAVLSACDTGLGDESNLTGASYGVLQAFKGAGVEKVLACLWRIDDNATTKFMQLFYRNLMQHDCVTALKMTQEGMKRSEYNEPYYWAPFVLYE